LRDGRPKHINRKDFFVGADAFGSVHAPPGRAKSDNLRNFKHFIKHSVAAPSARISAKHPIRANFWAKSADRLANSAGRCADERDRRGPIGERRSLRIVWHAVGGPTEAQGASSSGQPPGSSDMANQLIDTLDFDGDGALSMDELKTALSSTGSTTDFSESIFDLER